MFDAWQFYDHFTIDEASMAGAGGQPDDLQYLSEGEFKYLGNGLEPLDKKTFSSFMGIRTIFFREAKAHLDLRHETELGFEIVASQFAYNDQDYYDYVTISRTSLKNWFTKRGYVSKAFQEITPLSDLSFGDESLSARIKELESELGGLQLELDQLKQGRKLKQREQTVIDLIAALKNIILESTDLNGCNQTLSQNELVTYLSGEYSGAGTSERTYNELFAQINKLSRVKKGNEYI